MEEENPITEILIDGGHIGADRAMTKADLCKVLGLDDITDERNLRILIKREQDRELPIIAKKTGDGGYYLPADREELNDFVGRRIGEGKSLIRSALNARKAWKGCDTFEDWQTKYQNERKEKQQ